MYVIKSLVLLGVVIACALATRNWYAIPDLDYKQSQELITSVDTYAIVYRKIAIVQASASLIARYPTATLLKSVSGDNEELLVVHSIQEEGKESLIDFVGGLSLNDVLLADVKRHYAVLPSSIPLGLYDEITADPSLVLFHTSTFPMRPVRSYGKKFNYTEAEKRSIKDLVESVDRAALLSTVTELSSPEIFSRCSRDPGAKLAQDWIEEKFKSFGLPTETFNFRADMSDNVIAELKGTEQPDLIVVVGGHYDSRAANSGCANQRAPGADDNASGTATVIEMARLFTEKKARFKYTIQFMAFSGEEQGLLGSAAIANYMANQGDRVVAMMNFDMTSHRASGESIQLGFKPNGTPSLTEEMIELANAYIPSGSHRVCYGLSGSSDFRSFINAGYQGVGFFERCGGIVNPCYHRECDEIASNSANDFDQVKVIAQGGVAGVATTAGFLGFGDE